MAGLVPGGIVPAGLGWGIPYPFQNGVHAPDQLPALNMTQHNKMLDVLERLVIGHRRGFPQTSYLPLCLNAYNFRNRARVQNGLWAYIDPYVRRVDRPNPTDINVTPQASAVSRRVIADFDNPWTPFPPGHPVGTPITRLPNESRYRFAIFLHQHLIHGSAMSIYSMTVWDRQRGSLTWIDTRLEWWMQPDYVRRRADITLYWASVTVPFQNFPLAALDTNSTGQMYPHNELFDLAHEDVYPNHSLYQILACCVHFMDNIDSPLLPAIPAPLRNTLEAKSGMTPEYIPRLMVQIMRIVYRDHIALPTDGLQSTAMIQARFNIPNLGHRDYFRWSLTTAYIAIRAEFPLEFPITRMMTAIVL